MKKINQIVTVAGFSLYLFILIMSSQKAYADKTVYTIQTGSFLSEVDALTQYDLVVEALNEIDLDYLRIEKIGKYYSLRVGKFDDRTSADDLFTKVRNKFSTAIVMNAYIKNERIIKSYGASVNRGEYKTKEKMPPHDFLPAGLIYSVQTGSFSREITAIKQFELIMNKLAGSDLAFLRIEKIGKFYCLRAGNFKTRAAAAPVFEKMREIFPKAVIVDAYIKESRIVKLYSQESIVSNQSGKVKAAQEKVVPTSRPEIIKDAQDENHKEVLVKHSDESEDQKGHDVIKGEAKPSIENETLPELFFTDRKPQITSNLQKKIRPNNERTGDMYINKKQYFKALDEYQSAPYKRPILRRKLAMLLYKLGFVDEAISEIQEVIKASSASSSDRMMLGTLFLAKGNLSGAKEQFIAALEINPGNTFGYRYLAELFFMEKDYEMAWMSLKMARHLGYQGAVLLGRLSAVSAEPEIDPWIPDKEGIFLRVILVNTPKQAREILDRISDGELFEDIAGKESAGPGRNAGGFMGQLKPEEAGPEIVEALLNQTAFADPLIVKTKSGYHIVQRIAPFDLSLWKKMLADNGNEKQLQANGLQKNAQPLHAE